MYPGAEFYGIRKILLRYANLPGYLPLPVAVQHGWQRYTHSFEASTNPPEIWVWSHRIGVELEAKYPDSKIRVVGSFFCYLQEILKNNIPQVERQGSICMPPHSSHFANTQYSAKDFAKALDSLDDHYKPITVMLYYLDMNSSTVEEYEKFGFKVVSNGSLFDENFLYAFVENVYGNQNFIFSDLGSGVLFAKELGLNLVQIGIKSKVVNQGNIYITDEMISDAETFDDDFLRSLDEKLLSFELGKTYVLSPPELRALIFRNYWTWSFIKTFFRQLIGNVLRSIGVLKQEDKLK